MKTIHNQRFSAVAGNWAFLLVLFLSFAAQPINAAGIQDVAPDSSDAPVMLEIENEALGNFASYTSDPAKRLFASISDPSEILYFGLSEERGDDGDPYISSAITRYEFRVRLLTDDGTNPIVHGPFIVGRANANVQGYDDAVFGSYPTTTTDGNGNEIFVFRPSQAGDYIIEFRDIAPDANERLLIPFWDFTVTDAANTPIPGRVWSRSWSFRTPPIDGTEQPNCEWDRPFNGDFYTYTDDGFVSRIDFAGANFIGLSFDVAFNSTGPGSSGDLATDRMSIEGSNATETAAEHRIFLEEPDLALFPSGDCGELTTAEVFRCNGMDTYCLDVTVTEPGQVEIVLDFNGNGILDDEDDGLDVSIIFEFTEDMLSACVPWDGLRGDSTAFTGADTIDLVINYGQGVQHYAAFDVEFLSNGFCVETIRPTCDGGVSSNILFWDDRNISGEPGTGAPLDNRGGADCNDVPRSWNNFDIGPNQQCGRIFDDRTTGYGDKNTLNTYWFASTTTVTRVRLPITDLRIEGETAICEGGSTVLTAVNSSGDPIESFFWSGPNGDGATTESIIVTEPGEYCVTVTSEAGCTNSTCTTIEEIDFDSEQFPDELLSCAGEEVMFASPGNPELTYSWSPTTGIDDPTSNNPTFTPSETTTYTVTVSTDNPNDGCEAVEMVTIIVSPPLNLQVTGGGPICDANATITAMVDRATDISLLDAMGNVIQTQNGTSVTFMVPVSGVDNYSVTVTNEDGCVETVDFEVAGGPVDIAVPDTITSCLTQELVLNAQNLDPNDTLTFSWTPAELFQAGTETTANPEFIAGTGQYNVQVMAENQFGCTTTEEIEIFIIDENDVLDFTWELQCDGLTVIFTNTSTVGFGYLWLFGDGSFSTEVSPTHTYSSIDDFDVTLTFITEQECVAPSTQTVTTNDGVDFDVVVTGPDGPLTGPDAPDTGLDLPGVSTCGEDVPLTVTLADGADGDITVTYTDINGNDLGDGTDITLTPNAMDTIIVTTTNDLGCESMDTIVINNNQVDAAIDASADGLMFCTSTDTTVAVVNNRPGDILTYNWEPNDIITGPLDGPTVMITSPSEGSVDLTVTVTNQFGCMEDLTVTIANIPFMPNDFPDVVTPCFGEPTTIMGGPVVPGLEYTFDPSDNLDLTDPANPIGTFTEDESINVTITDPLTGCTDMQTIMVDVQPEIDFMASPQDTSICEPGMVTVSGSSINANADITWYSDAELTMVISEEDDVTIDANAVGETFTIFGQAVDSETGCDQTITVTVTVSELSNGLPMNMVNACAGEDAPGIFAPGTFNPDFVYTFDPADVVSTADPMNPVFTGDMDQEITVTVTDPATGCSATSTVDATFTDLTGLMIDGVEMINLGQEATIMVTGCDDCEYTWTTDNGTVDPDSSATTIGTPTEVGNANYTVDVTRNGCTETLTITVEVVDPLCDETRVFVPNAFTPNNDGNNDVMQVRSNFADLITEFRFIIYNRWGQEVYNSEDIDESWDGTVEGDDLEPDVYGYWMRALCPSGEELIQQGNITILR